MSEPLSDDERSQLSARADEFHAALARGAGADWGPFLSGVPDGMRRAVLTELVIIDLIHRWERGQRPEVEEYIARYPELGPADRLPGAIIVEECRCRGKAGERYTITRYRDRFPAQFDDIRDDLESVRPSTVVGPGSKTVTDSAGAVPAASDSGLHSNAEQYEMVRQLGRGVFGEVWLARKRTSGIEKAIKVVTQPAEKEAGRRERRALELIKNLRHPYLLATEDFWVSGGRLHIVMELAECTLRNRLDEYREAGHAGVPEGELLGYIREAAEGLDFLHAKHVVHRDVKPDNILLLNRHAKVADFGLAWQQDKVLAPMKTFAGTPAYMAPEVWGKEGGPASDQYALAVTYCELRQGRPPMSSGRIEEMMFAHLDGVHDFESFIREEERKVLERAMARMPEQRFGSCMEFVEALAIALGLSVVPRSGIIPAPGSRLMATPSSGQMKALAESVGKSVADPRGSVAAMGTSETMKRTHGGTGSGTVADPPRPTGGAAARKARRLAAAAAALLTVGLFGGIAFAVYSLFFKQDPNSSTAGDGGSGPGTNIGPRPTTEKKKDMIDPPPVARVLPPNATPDSKATVVRLADGREAYDWVIVKVASEDVRMRLITPLGGPRPVAPFYIMESKVWNGLYAAGGGNLMPESKANGSVAPATGMSAEEAATFAWAAFGKQFRLPSPEEWDHAAGLYKVAGRDEVTRPGGQPRVRLKKPGPTHGPDARDDVNEFDLIDMAGNGREFTRTIQTPAGAPPREVMGGSVVPLDSAESVILRGRNFTLHGGLTFEIIRKEHATLTQRMSATARSPYTGFRVVVGLP